MSVLNATSAWLRSHPLHVGNSVLIPLRPGKKQPLVSHKLPGGAHEDVHGLLPDIPESLLSKVCSRRPARRRAKSSPDIGSCCRLLDSSSAAPSPPDATILTPSPIHMLVNMLSPIRAGEYASWMRVGWCLHNIDADRSMLPLWIAFSKQCMDRFVPGECDRLWDSMRDEGYTEASLHMWAKMDSPSEYAIFMHQTVESCNGTHAEIADVAFRLLRDPPLPQGPGLARAFGNDDALKMEFVRCLFRAYDHDFCFDMPHVVATDSRAYLADNDSVHLFVNASHRLVSVMRFYDHKPRTFKVTLQNLLGVVCHEQKKINGVNCTNVFMGFRLRWNDDEQQQDQ
eukprot:gene4711-18571_t